MEKLKGLIVSIYESKDIGNCSNGGISSYCDKVVLVGEGIPEIFEANESRPAVKIVHRVIGGRDYYHAEPVEPCPPGDLGYMAGGCYIGCSDSRFPFSYPISLHDRSESQEMYNLLSS